MPCFSELPKVGKSRPVRRSSPMGKRIQGNQNTGVSATRNTTLRAVP